MLVAPGIAITELVFVSEGAKGPKPILTAPASQVRGERSCNCLARRGGNKSCAAAESYLPKVMGVRNSSCASRFVFRIPPTPVLGTQRKRTQAPNLPPARKLPEVFVKPGGPRRPWKHGRAGTPRHAYVAATGRVEEHGYEGAIAAWAEFLLGVRVSFAEQSCRVNGGATNGPALTKRSKISGRIFDSI